MSVIIGLDFQSYRIRQWNSFYDFRIVYNTKHDNEFRNSQYMAGSENPKECKNPSGEDVGQNSLVGGRGG